MLASGLSLLVLLAAPDRSPSLYSGVPAGVWELSGALGLQSPAAPAGPAIAADLGLSRGLSENFQIHALWPGVSLRLGEVGENEWIAGAGIWGLGFSSERGAVSYQQGIAVALRAWFSGSSALALSLDVGNTAVIGVVGLTLYTGTAALGLTLEARNGMAIHFAVCLTDTVTFFPDLWQKLPRVGLGSVQRLGFRRPPLVEWRVAPNVSAGVFGSLQFPLAADPPFVGALSLEVLGGLTTWF